MQIDTPNITGSLVVDGQFQIPFGISGSQTTTPTSGSMFFNTTDREVAVYNGSSWDTYTLS